MAKKTAEPETKTRRAKGVDSFLISYTPKAKDADPVFYRGPDAKKLGYALSDLEGARHVEVELSSTDADGGTRAISFNVDRERDGDEVVDARLADLQQWLAENTAADS